MHLPGEKIGCWTRRAREITGDFQNHLQSIHPTLHHCCEINLLVEDLALEADGINPCQICVATQCALLLLCATFFQAIRTFSVSYHSSMLLFRFLALLIAWNTSAWGMSCSQKHRSKLWKKDKKGGRIEKGAARRVQDVSACTLSTCQVQATSIKGNQGAPNTTIQHQGAPESTMLSSCKALYEMRTKWLESSLSSYNFIRFALGFLPFAFCTTTISG